jgi:hypothetical protein
MKSTTTCRRCDRPTDAATLCRKCVHTLRTGLRNVVSLHSDLDTTVRAGATRYGDPAPGHATAYDSTRLPFDATRFAAEGPGTRTDHDTRTTLRTWAAVVRDTWPPITLHPLIVCTDPDCPRCVRLRAARRGHETEARFRTPPDATVAARAGYLSRLADRIARQPWADDLVADIVTIENRLRRAVDRPSDTWHAGTCGAQLTPERPHDAFTCPCECHHAAATCTDPDCHPGTPLPATQCDRTLWAAVDSDSVTCRGCSTTWTTDDRRAILLDEARDRVVTVDAAWRIVRDLVDEQVPWTRFSARVRQWKTRGRIRPVGSRVIEDTPRDVYLFADILTRLDTKD